MIKRLMMTVLAVALVLTGLVADYRIPQKTVPERIMNSVVFVEGSSGVVVYSDDERALVLSAFHVVADKIDLENEIANIMVVYLQPLSPLDVNVDIYLAKHVVINSERDLVLLEIELDEKRLDYSKIATVEEDPRLGEDIWLGSNPNKNYRSLKKGIVSSVDRLGVSNQYLAWEVSGGIIFGSSGGGAFTEDGELFGVIRSVDALETDDCWIEEVEKEDGTKEELDRCQYIPVPYMGYIIPPSVIRSFLLESEYGKYFNYLK